MSAGTVIVIVLISVLGLAFLAQLIWPIESQPDDYGYLVEQRGGHNDC